LDAFDQNEKRRDTDDRKRKNVRKYFAPPWQHERFYIELLLFPKKSF
jgi:hypothetical protein